MQYRNTKSRGWSGLFLRLELRCGNPNGGIFVGLDMEIQGDDFDAVARRIPAEVDKLYRKALLIQ